MVQTKSRGTRARRGVTPLSSVRRSCHGGWRPGVRGTARRRERRDEEEEDSRRRESRRLHGAADAAACTRRNPKLPAERAAHRALARAALVLGSAGHQGSAPHRNSWHWNGEECHGPKLSSCPRGYFPGRRGTPPNPTSTPLPWRAERTGGRCRQGARRSVERGPEKPARASESPCLCSGAAL
ncbi:unnamed protein product [Prorocentrum cordatum]|uniref:Uncharacterized protein n=1 Tax=Prorocentrum cordatum TaxID=2364126 RepID=A0ABN9TUY9_9DINO|nr:unnamed protein product [Polarella glacialis]